jgi:collagenase-like PrtC family protease
VSGHVFSALFWVSAAATAGCARKYAVCRSELFLIKIYFSLKDLSLIDYVNELKSIGVKALKIEGRMKGADYVYTAISQFKKAANNKEYDKDILEKSFSRSGFTQGYYLSKINSDMFGIRSDEDKSKSQENRSVDIVQIKIPVDIKFNISKDKTELIISDDIGNTFISYVIKLRFPLINPN